MIRAAEELGVTGWVRNRMDGTVEAVFRGNAPARDAMMRWAHCGPVGARVERVTVREATAEESAAVEKTFRRLGTC
jgi:acylphosphatase